MAVDPDGPASHGAGGRAGIGVVTSFPLPGNEGIIADLLQDRNRNREAHLASGPQQLAPGRPLRLLQGD